ncbi:unnamed protein product [Arctogadus glacialis]
MGAEPSGHGDGGGSECSGAEPGGGSQPDRCRHVGYRRSIPEKRQNRNRLSSKPLNPALEPHDEHELIPSQDQRP